MTIDLRPDHRLIRCTLPTRRRRWIGLVSACAVCGRLHTLRVKPNVFHLRGVLEWVPLEPAKEMRED